MYYSVVRVLLCSGARKQPETSTERLLVFAVCIRLCIAAERPLRNGKMNIEMMLRMITIVLLLFWRLFRRGWTRIFLFFPSLEKLHNEIATFCPSIDRFGPIVVLWWLAPFHCRFPIDFPSASLLALPLPPSFAKCINFDHISAVCIISEFICVLAPLFALDY